MRKKFWRKERKYIGQLWAILSVRCLLRQVVLRSLFWENWKRQRVDQFYWYFLFIRTFFLGFSRELSCVCRAEFYYIYKSVWNEKRHAKIQYIVDASKSLHPFLNRFTPSMATMPEELRWLQGDSSFPGGNKLGGSSSGWKSEKWNREVAVVSR